MNKKYMSVFMLIVIAGVRLYAPSDAEKKMQEIFNNRQLTKAQIIAAMISEADKNKPLRSTLHSFMKIDNERTALNNRNAAAEAEANAGSDDDGFITRWSEQLVVPQYHAQDFGLSQAASSQPSQDQPEGPSWEVFSTDVAPSAFW